MLITKINIGMTVFCSVIKDCESDDGHASNADAAHRSIRVLMKQAITMGQSVIDIGNEVKSSLLTPPFGPGCKWPAETLPQPAPLATHPGIAQGIPPSGHPASGSHEGWSFQ